MVKLLLILHMRVVCTSQITTSILVLVVVVPSDGPQIVFWVPRLVAQFRNVLVGVLAGKPRLTHSTSASFSLFHLSFSCEWIFFSHYYFGYFTVDKSPGYVCVYNLISLKRETVPSPNERKYASREALNYQCYHLLSGLFYGKF